MVFPGFFHVGFGLQEAPSDFRGLWGIDQARYALFCLAMLKRGVRALERGAWFVSAAHTNDVLDETIAVVTEAAREVAS